MLANIAVDDNRTVLGKTVSRLRREMNCENLTPDLVRKNLKYFPVPPNEEWRLTFLDDLLSVETKECKIDDCFSLDDVKALISTLCPS